MLLIHALLRNLLADLRHIAPWEVDVGEAPPRDEEHAAGPVVPSCLRLPDLRLFRVAALRHAVDGAGAVDGIGDSSLEGWLGPAWGDGVLAAFDCPLWVKLLVACWE